MKNFKLFFFSAILVGMISCSSDDTTGEVEVSIDQSEETVLDANEVAQNILIDGAIQETGEAPSPTGSLPFSMSTDTQSAFQKNGFDITFEAPDSYAGAYIQFQSSDGNAASGYFDVPAGLGRKALIEKKNKFIKTRTVSSRVDEVEIDVDFENVPPGKFCYIICIYDTNGNISEPVEVCVEVEAWGGNPNLIGTWNFTKSIEDGETILVGEEYCEDYAQEIYCQNGEQITIENPYCYTIESLPIIFKEDGTYEFTSTDIAKDLDYNQTQENCTATFEDEDTETYYSKGKWAYDEEEGKLTLVEFEYTETSDGETYQDTYEDGELVFNGDTTISGSTMVIQDSYTEDNTTYTYEYFFSKN